MAINTRLLTVEDLMKPEHARVEIINGEVIQQMTASVLHHVIARNIFRILDAYTTIKGHGEVFFDGLHYLMYSSQVGLKDSFLPDASFIRKDDIIAGWNIDKPYPGVPTLAVEVISDSETASTIEAKVNIYLEKGTEQVWVVYPSTKTVYQHINATHPTVTVYRGSAQLNVESLFPGLTLTTDQIFAMPDWVNTPPDAE